MMQNKQFHIVPTKLWLKKLASPAMLFGNCAQGWRKSEVGIASRVYIVSWWVVTTAIVVDLCVNLPTAQPVSDH